MSELSVSQNTPMQVMGYLLSQYTLIQVQVMGSLASQYTLIQVYKMGSLVCQYTVLQVQVMVLWCHIKIIEVVVLFVLFCLN